MAFPLSYAPFRHRIKSQGFELKPAHIAALADRDADDWLAAYEAFILSARATVAKSPAIRPALPAPESFLRLCQGIDKLPAATTAGAAHEFFANHFAAFRICRNIAPDLIKDGFLTGYYEPEVEGSLVEMPGFACPILSRPDDLVTIAPGESLPGIEAGFSAGRRMKDGRFAVYPSRAAIETGETAVRPRPVVWLRDAVEVFLIQVQGSARVRLPDRRVVRLVYAGRNGHPYTSIGRILIEEGAIPESSMSLARLKLWIREAGQKPGDAGLRLMHRNHSYVFFKIDETLAPQAGPVGAAGISLTPLRSIAVDRTLWHYGLPFWIDANLPWQTETPSIFQRLMVAQDTGSAIIGPARADLFFGSGEKAGKIAGDIRHNASVHVMLPDERWG